MPYSYSQTEGDGTTTVLSFSFPYLRQADIHVYVGGVETTSFAWIGPAEIQLGAPPAPGVAVLVRRVTNYADAVSHFVAGGLDFRALNSVVNQLLYALQEQADASTNLLLGKPTSDPHSVGELWNNGGFLCVSQG